MKGALPSLRPQLQRLPQQPPLPAPMPLRSPASGAVSDRSSSLNPGSASAALQRSSGRRETAADTWRSAANAAGQLPRPATLQSDTWHSEKSQRSEARQWRPPLPPAAEDADGSEERESQWQAVRAGSSGAIPDVRPWRSCSEPAPPKGMAAAIAATAAPALSAAAKQRRQPPPGFEGAGSSGSSTVTSPTSCAASGAAPAAAAAAGGTASLHATSLAAATYAAAVGPGMATMTPGNAPPWQQRLPPPAAPRAEDAALQLIVAAKQAMQVNVQLGTPTL